MKWICPTCGKRGYVIETRTRKGPGQLTARRHQCANKHRWSTIDGVQDEDDAVEAPTAVRRPPEPPAPAPKRSAAEVAKAYKERNDRWDAINLERSLRDYE